MKRIGYLYEKICTYENILEACSKAAHAKQKSYGVIRFKKDMENNILQIQNELMNETYRISDYDVFTITDPKERIIYRLPFKDRVVQHAIMNVMETVWTSLFVSQTYSCVKGRGIHGAVKHIHRDIRDMESARYCLKLDIRKFYPSIDHGIMKSIIRKKIKDAKLLRLLDGIIDSAPGLPIGNYLSQFLANLYLSYFDHWIKEEKRVRYYYRYADDIVILAADKPYLHGLLVEINHYLADNLNLQLKGNFQVFPVESRGINFVGYIFYHNHTLMRKRIKKNFCRRVARLNKKEITSLQYKIQICSWIGWAKHCDSRHLIKTIIKNEEVLRLWN